MKYFRLIFSIVVIQLVGILGSVFTSSAIAGWYNTIQKPSWTPPGWFIGSVWTVLYLLMAIALFLIWQKAKEDKGAKKAFWFFWVHLIFNATWSPVFFGLQSPGLALINIAVLWVLIVILAVWFFRVRKLAGYLIWPYLLWVSFASVLNFLIWRLN